MSYQANVDIVIALNSLKITSFRKQGRLRFRLSLIQTTTRPQNTKVTHSQTAGNETTIKLLHSLQHI